MRNVKEKELEKGNAMNITASSLYDYIQCPHKVWRDIYGPQEEKIQETNPFVQLLWEKGVIFPGIFFLRNSRIHQ